MVARQLYNNQFFRKYFTSTVIMDGYICWMNDTKTGYYKISVDSGEVREVDTIEDMAYKYVSLADLIAVSRAMSNFINMCGTMAGYERPLPKISHQVLDGIGYKVTTRAANETDLMLWASHDVYLELAKAYVSMERILSRRSEYSYLLKNEKMLAITISGEEVTFSILNFQLQPIKSSILEMRDALREFVLHQQLYS